MLGGRSVVLPHLQVSSGVHTLNPVFADNLMRFQHVGMRSMLRVLVYDRRSALDSRLLGVASLPAAAVPASSSTPVYMWVPLSPPASRGKGRLGKLQVRLDDGQLLDRCGYVGITDSNTSASTTVTASSYL
jgi:hypothetical protein